MIYGADRSGGCGRRDFFFQARNPIEVLKERFRVRIVRDKLQSRRPPVPAINRRVVVGLRSNVGQGNAWTERRPPSQIYRSGRPTAIIIDEPRTTTGRTRN